MNSIFNELDHRLSVVKRWGILHTIQTQSVAEHCFNVERIATRIAVEWFGITDPEAMLRISQYALHHDDFEALSGDLPTMVKPYFNEKEFEADHSDLVNDGSECQHQYVSIVKLADMLEGYHFLCIETKLGNSYASEHWAHEPERILKYVSDTWGEEHPAIDYTHNRMIDFGEERSVRHSKRGR